MEIIPKAVIVEGPVTAEMEQSWGKKNKSLSTPGTDFVGLP